MPTSTALNVDMYQQELGSMHTAVVLVLLAADLLLHVLARPSLIYSCPQLQLEQQCNGTGTAICLLHVALDKI